MQSMFGSYEVLARVAAGSTGVVFKARHLDLDRVAAIKELSPALRGVPGLLERMRAEAELLARLDDPHIVEVYDFVEDPERVWIAEQWVDGASLETILREHGKLTPEQSVGVVRGALMGLAYAHDRDLLHRDFSTGNVLADLAGTSMLVDFGLAAPVEGASTSASDPSALGTPAFMSPESVRGEPTGKPSDVYSAASVLFTLLAGQPPFPGADVASVLRSHLETPAPLLEGSGADLQDLLHRSMSKDPASRPPDAAAFLAELEEAARRRFGGGWLERASIASIVGSVVAAAGTAATGLAGTAGSVVVTGAGAAETIVVDTGAAGLPEGSQGKAPGSETGNAAAGALVKPARTSRVVLGAAAAAVVLVVIGGGAVAVSRADNNSDKGAAHSASGATPTPKPTPAPSLLDSTPQGRYRVTQRVIASDNDQVPVGQHAASNWTFGQRSCTATSCAGLISTSNGLKVPYAWNGSRLTVTFTFRSDHPDVPCLDGNGGTAPGTLVRWIDTYRTTPFATTRSSATGGAPTGLKGTLRYVQTAKVLKGKCTGRTRYHVTYSLVGVLVRQ